MDDQRQNDVVRHRRKGVQLYERQENESEQKIEHVPGAKQRNKAENNNQDIGYQEKVIAWIQKAITDGCPARTADSHMEQDKHQPHELKSSESEKGTINRHLLSLS